MGISSLNSHISLLDRVRNRLKSVTGNHGERVEREQSPTIPQTDHFLWRALQAGKDLHVPSATLGETVVWIRDEAIRARVQARHPTQVFYTLEEITTLLIVKCDADHLRTIHAAKKILGGIIRPPEHTV